MIDLKDSLPIGVDIWSDAELFLDEGFLDLDQPCVFVFVTSQESVAKEQRESRSAKRSIVSLLSQVLDSPDSGSFEGVACLGRWGWESSLKQGVTSIYSRS